MVDFLAPIVNFTIMVLILGYALRKPFREFLVSRSDVLSKEIREAELEARKAAEELALWEAKMRDSKEHVVGLERDVRSQIETKRKESVAWRNSEVERIGREANLVGESEAARARAGVQREVARRSLAAARAYIESHVTDKDRKQLVKDYLEIVGNGATR